MVSCTTSPGRQPAVASCTEAVMFLLLGSRSVLDVLLYCVDIRSEAILGGGRLLLELLRELGTLIDACLETSDCSRDPDERIDSVVLDNVEFLGSLCLSEDVNRFRAGTFGRLGFSTALNVTSCGLGGWVLPTMIESR